MRRLVLDASVLLAAPVGRPEGSPSLLIEAARSGVIEMIACETLFAEFERGLERYFRDRVHEDERVLIAAMVRRIATELPDPVAPPAVVRDSADDYLVALARAANRGRDRDRRPGSARPRGPRAASDHRQRRLPRTRLTRPVGLSGALSRVPLPG